MKTSTMTSYVNGQKVTKITKEYTMKDGSKRTETQEIRG